MKKQADEGRFNYWRTLFVHLVQNHKVAYARSITMEEGKYTYNGKLCIHKAIATYRKGPGILRDEKTDAGHLEICTWEENTKLNPRLQRRKSATDPFENWVPLIAYMEQRPDVRFIRSITMTENSVTIKYDKY